MKDKKVLVTGASRGIGKSIAEILSKEGYSVIGTYNTGSEEAKAIQDKYENIEFMQVNFSDRNSTLNFIKKLENEKFTAIINNAGMIDFEDWDEFSMELWDKTMEVNLNTPMLISHKLRDNLEMGGSIVNISSTDGMIGSLSSIAYSASKAALLNLTQSLANVFAEKKIRVNAIAPGWVGDGMDSPAIEEAKWVNPLGRTADYKEIAKVVKFLISEDASYINGSTITVDGGSMAVDYVLKKEDELTKNEN